MKRKEALHFTEDFAIGFMQGKSLLLGFKVGLFELPVNESKTVAEIAKTLSVRNQKFLRKLLNSLCLTGFFDQTNGLYFRTDKIALSFLHFIVQQIDSRTTADLYTQLKFDKRPGYFGLSNENWPLYMQAMEDIAAVSAKEIVSQLDLKGVQKLCDVGSGPGSYAREFAATYPQLNVTLFDIPESLKVAKANLQNCTHSDRLCFIEGSVTDKNWPGAYDAIFLSHVIHLFHEDEVVEIFETARKSLSRGGKLIVRDLFLSEQGLKPELGALLSLCVWNSGGAYSQDETKKMLLSAGYKTANPLILQKESDLPKLSGSLIEARA